jgi:hypothetical protein
MDKNLIACGLELLDGGGNIWPSEHRVPYSYTPILYLLIEERLV